MHRTRAFAQQSWKLSLLCQLNIHPGFLTECIPTHSPAGMVGPARPSARCPAARHAGPHRPHGVRGARAAGPVCALQRALSDDPRPPNGPVRPDRVPGGGVCTDGGVLRVGGGGHVRSARHGLWVHPGKCVCALCLFVGAQDACGAVDQLYLWW
jgi:hypothetical protein